MTKTRGFLLTAGIVLATTFTLSCSGDDGDKDEGGGSCSADFGEVTIGSQIWAKKNLNCNIKGSKCYGDDPANCEKYGRLYDWVTAMGIDAIYTSSLWNGSDVKHKGICPSGWHIPSGDDWYTLWVTVGDGSNLTAGGKLKAESGWNNNGNGTDDYNFTALPGGSTYGMNGFRNIGNAGRWWAASENSSGSAYAVEMKYDDNNVFRSSFPKEASYSVRCIKD